MKKKDFLLALLVVVIWGGNFTVIKLGIKGVPSLILASLRYAFVVPAVIFLRPPKIKFMYLLFYGLFVGVGQFSCLFYAMGIGMPAGLASIVLQSSAFITPIFALLFLKESINSRQIIGFFVAALGLCLIGYSINGDEFSVIPMGGLILTLMAASFWALSNIILKFASIKSKKNGESLNMLSVVVYSSMIPPIPLFLMAFLFDTPETIFGSLLNLNIVSILSVLYLSILATIFGYGTWSNLLSKYPVSYVAPLSLLVPITGLICAQIVLEENLNTLQWIGGIIILVGLSISNIDFSNLKKRKA